MEQCPEDESRLWNGLQSGSARVVGEGSPAVFTGVAAAVASTTVAKVLWRLVSRSQVGWKVGVNDIVLAHLFILLSSRGCIR